MNKDVILKQRGVAATSTATSNTSAKATKVEASRSTGGSKKNKYQNIIKRIVNIQVASENEQKIISIRHFNEQLMWRKAPILILTNTPSIVVKLKYHQIGRNSPIYECSAETKIRSCPLELNQDSMWMFILGIVSDVDGMDVLVIDPMNMEIKITESHGKFYHDESRATMYWEISREHYSWIMRVCDTDFELQSVSKSRRKNASKSAGCWFSCNTSAPAFGKKTLEIADELSSNNFKKDPSFMFSMSISSLGVTIFDDGPMLSNNMTKSSWSKLMRVSHEGDCKALVHATFKDVTCDVSLLRREYHLFTQRSTLFKLVVGEVGVVSCLPNDKSEGTCSF
jgi:hypothetical protein